jgi:hypothetical protein
MYYSILLEHCSTSSSHTYLPSGLSSNVTSSEKLSMTDLPNTCRDLPAQQTLFFFIYFNFLVVIHLNLGPHTCCADALPFEPLSQPIFVLNIFETGPCGLFAWAGF